MTYHFESLTSTNDEAQDARYAHGDIVVAERQSAGRGQRGHKWFSGAALNLTFSAVVMPNIELQQQFLISQASALAICDVLKANGIAPKIKWTNDIYVGDEKIAGILIENKLSGSIIARSVVGIGVNVNQQEFDSDIPNPTSMALVAGRCFERESVLDMFEKAIIARFEMLAVGGQDTIIEEYHALMYRRFEVHDFRLPQLGVRSGVIQGVKSSGELIVDWVDGEKECYLFGAIDFIIDKRKR